MTALGPWPGRLRRRPGLAAGLGVALGAGLLAATWLPASSAGLVGWCLGLVAYMALSLRAGWRLGPEGIRRRAEELDEGQDAVTAASLVATIVSLVAVGVDVAGAKGSPGAGFSAVLGVATVALSWAFVHVLFAHRYMHEDSLRGGLEFPGNARPDLAEYLYAAFTVGMTAQVSDVTTSSATMRRLVLVHALVAFVFNAAIVAAAVNVAAGLAS